MAKYCQPDRTPCDQLIAQLGVCVFGDEDSQRFFILTTDRDHNGPTPLPLEYCPFCGCRLAEMPFVAGERIKIKGKKKRRGRSKKQRSGEEESLSATPSFPSST